MSHLGWIAVAIAACLVISTTAFSNSSYFDCRRFEQPCINSGSCDYESGDCLCSQEFAGYDCSVSQSTIIQDAACGPQGCMGRGICVSDPQDKQASCFCNEEADAEACQEPRQPMLVECEGDTMNITFKPYRGFRGIAHVMGQKGQPVCSMKETFPGHWSMAVPLKNGCGFRPEQDSLEQKVKQDDEWLPAVTYSRLVMVQYNPEILQANDELYRVSCILVDRTLSLTGAVAPIHYQSDSFEQGSGDMGIVPIMGVLRLRVLSGESKNELTVDEPVVIGDSISLEVSLIDTSIFPAMRVEWCVATDTSGQFNNVTLFERGCIGERIRGLVSEEIIETPVEFVLPLRAFKFSDQSRVEFLCSARVCSEPENCAKASCMRPELGQRVKRHPRRRRDVSLHENHQEEEARLKTAIVVVEPGSTARAAYYRQQSTVSPAQLDSIYRIPFIIVTSILTFVLLLLLVLLCRIHAAMKKSMP